MNSIELADAAALKKARRLILEGGNLLVAVDSNAFFTGMGKARRVSFNQDWINKFRGLAARGERLLLSSVWDVEIRRHFQKSIDSQVKIKLPTFARVPLNRNSIDELNSRASALRSDAKALVEREWDSVKASLNAELVAIAQDPTLAVKIFDLWANTNLPFETKKPDEFQDAFALLSLHAYTENLRIQSGSVDTSVLVVTADAGCREFCRGTTSLIPCSNIDSAVEFLAQRQEINRLANRSCELGEVFSNPSGTLFRQLGQSFLEVIRLGFPPREFSFDMAGRKRSGWLSKCEIDSILLLPSGPRGSLVEVVEDRSGYTQITGKLKLKLAMTLTEPRYSEGTACPSAQVILSEYKSELVVEFNAYQDEGHWYGCIGEVPQHLTASEH